MEERSLVYHTPPYNHVPTLIAAPGPGLQIVTPQAAALQGTGMLQSLVQYSNAVQKRGHMFGQHLPPYFRFLGEWSNCGRGGCAT